MTKTIETIPPTEQEITKISSKSSLEQLKNNKNDAHVTLSSPLILKKGQVIKNRIMKSATSEQLGDDRHNPSKGLLNVYQAWSEGDVGLIVTGNIMIDRTALGEPRNIVLDNQSDLAKFKKWASVAKQNNTHCWAQLNHPGRQSPIFLSSVPVAPSAVPINMGKLSSAFAKPRALTTEEVWEIVDKFATSAYLAKLVGFTGVQIHGAHGYLISQFLSPSQNKRTDEWGGSDTKRMKFVLEIYKAIRAEVGDSFPIGIKLNSADFQKEGFSETASMAVVNALSDLGIDHVEISGGSYESQAFMGDNGSLKHDEKNNKKRKKAKKNGINKLKAVGKTQVNAIIDDNSQVKESSKNREAYFLNYAEKLREVSDVPLTVTGGFRSAQGMQDALDDGATDLIGLARPLLIYPHCARDIIEDINYVIAFKTPSTGIKIVDDAAMLNITWYEEQIHRIAKGLQPDPTLSAWVAVAKMYSRMGKKAFAQRRA